MAKRVFIVHGWGGTPGSDWYKWLKGELENRGFKVSLPKLPNTMEPEIKTWVSCLDKLIGKPDSDTFLIGHSIGCQAIMRYMEKLPADTKIGGAIFVAGWFNLSDNTWDEDYTKQIASPWLNTSIDFDKIKTHTNKFVAIQSDNDPYVPFSDKDLFKKNLGAKIIVLKNKGHINGEDGVTELPIALKELLEISK